jgi:hypothetical protein
LDKSGSRFGQPSPYCSLTTSRGFLSVTGEPKKKQKSRMSDPFRHRKAGHLRQDLDGQAEDRAYRREQGGAKIVTRSAP